MKTARVLACCLLAIPLVGTAPRSVPHPRAQTLTSTSARTARLAPLETLKAQGLDLLRQGRYTDAQIRFQSLRESALAMHEIALAARATANVGACQFFHRQYQAALGTFLEAGRLAEYAGDTSEAAIVDHNIGSLYSEMGEIESAAEWTERSLERMSGRDRKLHLPMVQISLASLRARQNRSPEAMDLFRQGIDGAARVGDLEVYALGWDHLGAELLKSHLLDRAEPALLEAYRVRKLHHLALERSYRTLGRLRLEQGDLAAASTLLDRAVERAVRPDGPLPAWDIYHYRGRVRLRQGRLPEAMADLRIALRLARAWRWAGLADDASRIGEEGWISHVDATLVEAGNRLYNQTGNPHLIRETFEAAEENRASSLRTIFNERQAQIAALPPSYWEAVARLQSAEVRALRSADPEPQQIVKAARAELTTLEASFVTSRADPDTSAPAASDMVSRVSSALGPDTALLSFYLGASTSWLWAVDRNGLVLYSLPPETQIESQAQAAVRAIRDDTPQAAAAGAALYRTLFGPLSPRFRQKSRWLLSLDPALLDIPVAALIEEARPRPVYVVERHITDVIPGAGFWLDSVGRPSKPATADGPAPLFVGIGDPIYNAADPRHTRHAAARASWSWPWKLSAASLDDRTTTGGPASLGLVLPRLVGSGAELAACARSWTGESILLRGAAASRRALLEQLRRNPAVIHFATHVLSTNVAESHAQEGQVSGSAGRPAYGLIALSLTDRNELELLTPMEISRWKVSAGLVVLSGCDSAQGTVLQGTGLMGLTRAWLAAGARFVVSSRWATPDENGSLFRAFYRNLARERRTDPVQALRAAQLEMIHSGDWRARPRYWGAYFMTGNQ